MFEKSFERLGFSDKEQSIYLALAELGQSSVTVLSKQTSIARATLYAVLDNLITKGVVSRQQTRGATLYLLNSTSSLQRLVDKERTELQEKDQAAKELIDLLTPYIKSSHYGLPKVQLFEGKQNIDNMLYDNLAQWRKSNSESGENILWGYQDHTIVEIYRRWHQHMWDSRQPEERICLLSNAVDVEKELHLRISNREVRALPAGVQFSSSIWIYGEYIIMAVTRRKPHYAVQMKDPMLSSNLRAIFQLLWKARF